MNGYFLKQFGFLRAFQPTRSCPPSHANAGRRAAVAGLSVVPDPYPAGEFSHDPAIAIVRDTAEAVSRYLGHTRFTGI